MIQIYLSKEDFHLATAKAISQLAWKIPPEAVEAHHRASAKTTNFALLYEIPEKLGWMVSRRLSCSTKEGERIADAIFGKFKKLREWMAECLRQARIEGGAWTQWRGKRARFRPLWNIAEMGSDRASIARRENAERSSWNTPAQGSAADFTTASLWPVVDWIQTEGIPARIVLTIYDSIILDVREDWAERVARRVKQVMESWDNGPIPLEADVKAGKSWGSLEKMRL